MAVDNPIMSEPVTSRSSPEIKPHAPGPRSAGIQRAALKAASCRVIRVEKASGTRRDGRTELQVLLDFMQPGDMLVVTRIDRLARQ